MPPAWHEQTEWEAEVAYQQGYADGYAAANAEIVAQLAQSLGGPGTVDYPDGVRRHHLAVSQRAARAAADSREPVQ